MQRPAANPMREIAGLTFLAGLGVALAAVISYFLAARAAYGPGFPLDDAWIHQTYARNLVEQGSWAFQGGQASGGSTSPLWTGLQVPAHLLGVNPVIWSGLVGLITLAALAGSGTYLWRALRPAPVLPAGLVAVALASEWHLVWAALSGMETLLAAVLPVGIALQLVHSRTRPGLIGLSLGLGLWIRPDLLTLAAVVLWWVLLGPQGWQEKKTYLLQVGAGFAALAFPYAVLQLRLSGEIWPSTFFAKQAEYSVLRESPLFIRYLRQWRAPLAGVLAVILPGALYWFFELLNEDQWRKMAFILWPVLYLAMFASRLPVTYQHGRYAMPAIPIMIVIGVTGWESALDAIRGVRARWVALRAWLLATGITAALFLFLGARAYVTDVGVIESEMVTASQWIAGHTDRDALIAAHDIGALGYYGQRPILDLAGLVSPQVIPFLRDEIRLEQHLDQKRADYLMTFPSWYPYLTDRAVLLYSTGGQVSPQAGGENMGVYRWVR